MTNIPLFSQRRVSEETSGRREEIIKELWTFLKGISTERLRIPGSEVGAILVVGTGGEILSTLEPSGNLTFSGDIVFSDAALFMAGLVAGATLSGQPNASVTTAGLQLDQAAANPLYVRWFDSGTLSAVTLYAEAGFAGDATHRLAKDIGGRLVVVGNDAPAVAAENLGKVDLTGQVANIASTALSNTPPAGFYEVEVYLETTTNDATAGTLAVVVGWTDDVGATTSTVIAAHALTATGRSTGRAIVRLASGNLTYSVTVTGIYATAAYAVYVRVTSLG